MSQKHSYFTLFRSTFMLSAFTFGGGYVIIPLMKKKFADDLGWLEEEEMLNLAAMAQSAPGPVAVNASVLIGWKCFGFWGAIVSVLGTVMPPLLILSVISLFYAAFRSNPVVNAVLKGMMAGVAAVIFDVAFTLISRVMGTRRPLPLILLLGAFISAYFFHVNVIYIILFCGTVGALAFTQGKKRGHELL